ncbi:MAG: hypothetical protein V4555_06130 [Acidobacteriota bacterium]
MSLNASSLKGWIPVQLRWDGDEPRVRWILLGERRLVETRFERTIDAEMRRPFHHLFRRDTSMAEMEAWVEAHPGLEFCGMVFHLSRCGSTRMAERLAANEQYVVAAQPGVLESLLEGCRQQPELAMELKVRWVRALVGALAQPRAGGEQRFFLKAEPWQVHDVELLRAAFPDVAMLFLYREPLAVMVSHAAIPAEWLIPGVRRAARVRMVLENVEPGRTDLYRGRALAAICESGLRAAEQYGAMLVNDAEAPGAMWERVARHFGVPLADLPELADAAEMGARDRRVELEERLRGVTDELLRSVYTRLETARRAQVG